MGRDDGYYCYVLCFLSKVPSFYSIHWSFYRPMQVLSHVVERSVFRKRTLQDLFQSLKQFFDQNIVYVTWSCRISRKSVTTCHWFQKFNFISMFPSSPVEFKHTLQVSQHSSGLYTNSPSDHCIWPSTNGVIQLHQHRTLTCNRYVLVHSHSVVCFFVHFYKGIWTLRGFAAGTLQ